MQNSPAARDATSSADPQGGTAAASKHNLKHRVAHEAVRFGVMFVYLWVVFGLFVLFERIIRGQIGLGYQSQGFAFINALVLAKVMVVAEDLRLDRGMRAHPIGLAALAEAALFALVFIAFHVLERIVVGVMHSATLVASVPSFGGGGFAGLVTVATIMFVVLIPYFAFRDLGRALGAGELRRLLFSRPPGTGP